MKPAEGHRAVATNRQARRDYEILETFEAGLVLVGSEVKSLRDGRANLKDAYADLVGDELYLVHMHISPYAQAGPMGHEPERRRKLLMKRRELERLRGKLVERGLTLIPLSLYFKGRWVKVELGLGRGKKQYDKRQDVAERESKREMARAMRRDVKSGREREKERGDARGSLAALRGRAGRLAACVLLSLSPLFLRASPALAESALLLVHWGPGVELERAEATLDNGTLYFPVNEVARWFGMTKSWDPATLTLTLTASRHALRVNSGNRWVTLDGRLVNLTAPVRMVQGSLEVPFGFVEELAPELLDRRVHYEPERGILTFHRRDVNILRLDLNNSGDGSLGVHVELAESLGFALDASRPGEVRLRIDKGKFDPGMEQEALPVLPIRHISAGYDGGMAEIIFAMADEGGTATAAASEGGRGIEIDLAGFVPEGDTLPALEPRPFPTRPVGGRQRGTPLILVDPGHGGTERGAIGPSGFLEKKATLEIALHLKHILSQNGSFRVMLTREDDRLVPLVRRAEMANLFDAAVFLSVHCNSWPGGTADGFEVYVCTPSPPTDSAAVAAGGMVRWDAAQDMNLEESRLLAGFVREELGRLGLRDRGTRSGKFVVLRGVEAPAALVETAFISNPEEEARLQDDGFREQLAQALADAVRRFAAAPAGAARPAGGE